MPGSVLAETTKTGKLLQFTEEDHRYVIKDKRSGKEEKDLISVTNLIHSYFPPFDPDGKVCASCAKRDNVTVEEMRARWDKNRDDAATLGTRCHEYMEDLIRQRKPRNEPQNDKEKAIFEHMAHFYKDTIKPNFEQVTPEKIVCDIDLGLAGTIDFLAKDPKADQYIMMDWKTNKAINMESRFGKYAFPPIEHIPDCEFGTYSLQLNLYEFILKHAGYIPPKAPVAKYIVHFQKLNGARVIQVPDRRREIEAILRDHLAKQLVNG